MSDRLTVVFDDPDLYRRLKFRAVEEDLPVKALIERAVRALLGQEVDILGSEEPRPMDWAAFDRWQAEAHRLDAAYGNDYPPDLSNVKKYLYGEGRGALSPAPHAYPADLMVAEAASEYNAG